MTVRRWDKSKPPTGPWALNKDAPQAQGLVAWYPMTGGGAFVPDLVAGANASLGPVVPRSIDQWGAPFVNVTPGASHYLEAPLTAAQVLPISFAGWFRPITGSARGIVSLSVLGGNTRLQLQAQTSNAIFITAVDSAGASSGVDSSVAPSDQWSHVAGVYASSTSRSIYVNAGSPATATGSVVTSGMDRLVIGARRNNSSVGAYFDNPIGEFGVWAIALPLEIIQRQADPGLRFELWYPLRSKKWMAGGVGLPSMQAAASAVATATAGLATQILLAADGAAQATAAAEMAVPLVLAASAAATATGSADLSTAILVQAPAGATATASGALSTGIPLAAAAQAGATSTADLLTLIPLQAAAACVATATADLTAMSNGFAASAVCSATATAELSDLPLYAAAAGSCSATADLLTGIRLSGPAAAAATATAELLTGIRLAAIASGSASATAVLSEVAPVPPLTNAQMQDLYLWLSELHKIHGLRPDMPLSVTQTARVAGDVSQTVAEAGGTVTVERV